MVSEWRTWRLVFSAKPLLLDKLDENVSKLGTRQKS